MSIERELTKRSGNVCELCGSDEQLTAYEVQPAKKDTLYSTIKACNTCISQIEDPDATDPNHWQCLNDSMWSEHAAIKVISWRMLARLKKHDLLDMMYLEEDELAWAKATGEGEDDEDDEDKIVHRDSNGAIINAGDSVVLIKDLPVKGSSMIAKRGTAVRRVSLDHENAEYIEGKVDGQQIVIITKYVKKI